MQAWGKHVRKEYCHFPIWMYLLGLHTPGSATAQSDMRARKRGVKRMARIFFACDWSVCHKGGEKMEYVRR